MIGIYFFYHFQKYDGLLRPHIQWLVWTVCCENSDLILTAPVSVEWVGICLRSITHTHTHTHTHIFLWWCFNFYIDDNDSGGGDGDDDDDNDDDDDDHDSKIVMYYCLIYIRNIIQIL